MSFEERRERVLEEAKKLDVRLVELQFVDLLGTTKSLTIPIQRLEKALSEGVGFDGSSIEGFVRIYESDMIAVPDPYTFRIFPWRPSEKKEARIICDLRRPGGGVFEGDPRYILKKALRELKEEGLIYNTGPELEFFLLRTDGEPRVEPLPHDVGSYFDFSPLDRAGDVRRDAIFTLQDIGLDVEMSHHEVAPGQHEIDFKFEEALTSADNVITYKNAIKATALSHGLYATFMPKPFFGVNGSGMHTHQSLYETGSGRNALYDPDDQYNLSSLAYHFIGGQLKHSREMSAVLAPTTNSYKRLVPGYEAPVYICWGRRNRSALIRVPEYHPENEEDVRAELRCPDPSCNPYLAFTVMLKAGLDGIKNKVQPSDPVEEDVYGFDDRKLAQFYVRTLPASLEEAINEFEESRLMKETLGDYAFERYLTAKKEEWDEYRIQVTNWELKKYMKL
ncbi:MAG: type I glutamate--ammonia ligase [Nitrososphaeria archaeon]|nr:type I glutamate--ammonia ligase [Nitrososphaeria archaeon]NIN52327.1 type I glutamate--ammonia ligase [Nitrososphaeria archaeon]NIQ32805.1 type I glutamate--ammonia ligase [Nitrososphaeria archaeon]